MKKELIADIVEWDIENWSKALYFWSKNIDIKNKEYTCLELGGRRGGLSLWLALNANTVICSDLKSPIKEASLLHSKYSVQDRIKYMSVDATDFDFENKFDIVIFKSILGSISINGNDVLKEKVINMIFKSLKPNGKLLFAENLESSNLHKVVRKRFLDWGTKWNYLKYDEIEAIFSSFDNVKYETIGFFGAFGRSEKQRKILGKIDKVFKLFIPNDKRYIVYGIAEKY